MVLSLFSGVAGSPRILEGATDAVQFNVFRD